MRSPPPEAVAYLIELWAVAGDLPDRRRRHAGATVDSVGHRLTTRTAKAAKTTGPNLSPGKSIIDILPGLKAGDSYGAQGRH
ncbi:cytochrome P450 [Methylocaldum marinum]|uniref:Cytochrome P450 n=1 Tax=Methylocaldum marinum TaxID=1432792 RepID=A0A286P399_9GAMM|nr:cytochrome P450 [Methylocaldum marinum]